MKISKIFSLALCVLFLLTFSLSAFAAETNDSELTFAVEASASTVQGGEEITVTVSLAENPGFKWAKMQLLFDANVLTYKSYSVDGSIYAAEAALGRLEVGTGKVFNGEESAFSFALGGMMGSLGYGTVTYDKTGVLFSVTFEVALDYEGPIQLTAGVTNPDREIRMDEFGDVKVKSATTNILSHAADHAYSETVVPGKEATCTESGLTEGKKCAVCGVFSTPQEVIPALGHDYQNGKCTRCKEIDPNCTHPYTEIRDAVKSTCTSTGYSGDVYCMDCGVLVEKGETTEVAAHTEEVIPGKAATCTETGLTDGKKCSVCSAVLVEQETIPVKGHAEEVVPGKEATCTETGLTDGKKCSVCGEVLLEQDVIPMKEHEPSPSFRDNIVDPTCVTPGSYDSVVNCAVCKKELSRETVVVPATGHTEEVIPSKAATCTEPGLTEGKKCAVCDTVLVRQEETPAKGHTEEVIPGKAATCTESGWTEGKKCSVCNTVLIEQEKTPAKGHTEEVVPGKAATCTEPGLTEGKRCTVCGVTTLPQDRIPAKGHTEEVIPGKEASCTEPGLTDGKRCTVCGVTTLPQETIAIKDHTEEIIPGKEATCTETGLTEGKKCSVCDKVLVEQKTIAKTAHTDEIIPGKEATCTEPGLTEGKKCSVCGEVTLAQEEIPMLEHSYKDGKCIYCGEQDPNYTEKTGMLGDINMDGMVNSSDVTMLFRYISKDTSLKELTAEQLLLADINQDGLVNSSDVSVLFRYVSKDASLTWEPKEIKI